MSLHSIRWFSQVLNKATETQVIFPDGGTSPFPTLYLLHGLSDDSSMWMRRSRIEIYAEAFPMIVVMPDGYRGFYTNNEQGPEYAKHIGEELPAFIERIFPAIAERSGRAIGGLSMGGYGALRLGLGYYERFSSIHCHSGAMGWSMNGGAERAANAAGRGAKFAEEILRIFGPSPDGSDHDLFTLAKQAKKARLLPKIQLDCGEEDFLIQDNRNFTARLKEEKIPHSYAEYPGAHTWDYWDTHIQKALKFHHQNFSVAQKKVSKKSAL